MGKQEKSPFKSDLGKVVASQFKGMWTMLRQTIENVSEDRWTDSSDEKTWFFSLTVYHIIETAEFYNRDRPDGMEWGKRLGKVNWWDAISAQEAAQRLTKPDVLDYLEEMEERTERILQGHTSESIMEPDGFRNHLPSILLKYMYSLRHASYHTGELAMKLRDWKCERCKWS